jgi:cytochrome P450
MSAVELDPLDLVDPARYAARGYPHDVWTRLRADDPVAYIEVPGLKPFWAITKHADVMEVARQPAIFSSAQGTTLAKAGQPPLPPMEILVLLDPPKHGPMRRLVSVRFTPKAVRDKRSDVERITLEVLDAAEPALTGGAPCEFVEQIAAPLPLGVVAWILGVPTDDWRLLYRLTNEIIGKDDPEFRRDGETPGQTIKRARRELHHYLSELIDARRAEPRDDLLSELVHGTIDGEPLTEMQLLAYAELFVEAGNETTRNAISGAILAFCERPAEWERLRANRELLPDAVEEILRWASPISHFTRVATEDYELRGRTIRAGDQLALFFASANRDEELFADPFTFRIDRHPNPHLAFGFGEHVCVGAHLARVEIEMVLRHLLDRVERFELAGPVERLHAIINGSIKRLPLHIVRRRSEVANG